MNLSLILKNGVWFEIELQGFSVCMEHGNPTKIRVGHDVADIENIFPLTITADCVFWGTAETSEIVSVDTETGELSFGWLPSYIRGEDGKKIFWMLFDIPKTEKNYELLIEIVDSAVHHVRLGERPDEEEVVESEQ